MEEIKVSLEDNKVHFDYTGWKKKVVEPFEGQDVYKTFFEPEIVKFEGDFKRQYGHEPTSVVVETDVADGVAKLLEKSFKGTRTLSATGVLYSLLNSESTIVSSGQYP